MYTEADKAVWKSLKTAQTAEALIEICQTLYAEAAPLAARKRKGAKIMHRLDRLGDFLSDAHDRLESLGHTDEVILKTTHKTKGKFEAELVDFYEYDLKGAFYMWEDAQDCY